MWGARLRDTAGWRGKKKPGLTVLCPHSDLAQPLRTGEGGWARLPKAGEGWNCYLMPPGASQCKLEPDPVRPWFSGKLTLSQVQKPPEGPGTLEKGGVQALRGGPGFFHQDLGLQHEGLRLDSKQRVPPQTSQRAG